jgi:hypothetical protein
VSQDYGPFPAHTQYGGSADCASGLHAVGGGVVGDGDAPGEQVVNSSYPDGTTGWAAYVDNLSSGDLGFTVYAVCAQASSVSGP